MRCHLLDVGSVDDGLEDAGRLTPGLRRRQRGIESELAGDKVSGMQPRQSLSEAEEMVGFGVADANDQIPQIHRQQSGSEPGEDGFFFSGRKIPVGGRWE